jgi:8-oxo-dGTP pyrophosphatase MutT (NUDIX family)
VKKPPALGTVPKYTWKVVKPYVPKYPQLAVPKKPHKVPQLEVNGDIYTFGIAAGGKGGAASLKRGIANGTFSGFYGFDAKTGQLVPPPAPPPPAPPKAPPKPKPPKPKPPGPAYSTPVDDEPAWSSPGPGRAQPADPKTLGPVPKALPPDLDPAVLKALDLHAVEPTWQNPPPGKKSYGVVFVNELGQVLLREPKNHFGGYHWTFPKGKQDAGEHPWDTAFREGLEESGHDAAPLGLVPGNFAGDSGNTNLFLARSKGFDPSKMDGETAQTKWVSPAEALDLIGQTTSVKGKARDTAILRAALKQLAKLQSDPHANDHLKAAAPAAPAPAAKPQKKASIPPPPPPPAAATTKPPPAPKPKPASKAPKAVKGAPAAFPADLSGLSDVKALGGHSGAQATLVRDPAGNLWVRKVGHAKPDQLREEAAADAAYAALGVGVPASRVYDTPAGPVKLAAYHDGTDLGDLMRRDPAAADRALAEVRKSFVADALLANWDVAGATFDNVKVLPSGAVLRIDNGGALRFRAQGAPKGSQWGAVVHELQSLRDPNVNAQSAKVFAGLTDDDIKAQIKAALRRRKQLLAAVPADVRATLEARLDYLKTWGQPPKPTKARKGTWAPRPESEFKRLDASSANRWGKAQFGAWGQALSAEEEAAVRTYTGSGYHWMNAVLRAGDYGAATRYGLSEAEAQRQVETLRAALMAAELREGVVVHRGVNGGLSVLGWDAKPLTYGEELTEVAFVSTSVDSGSKFSGDVTLEIRIPKGTRGVAYVNASNGSSHPSEKELLIAAGRARYRVVSHAETTGSYGRKKHHFVLELDQ